jgi:hypothetical protein
MSLRVALSAARDAFAGAALISNDVVHALDQAERLALRLRHKAIEQAADARPLETAAWLEVEALASDIADLVARVTSALRHDAPQGAPDLQGTLPLGLGAQGVRE